MALSITSSNFLNGDWILECQIDLPNDRQMVQDLLQMINPGLAVPQCPIGIPFRLRYQSEHNALTMTVPGEHGDHE